MAWISNSNNCKIKQNISFPKRKQRVANRFSQFPTLPSTSHHTNQLQLCNMEETPSSMASAVKRNPFTKDKCLQISVEKAETLNTCIKHSLAAASLRCCNKICEYKRRLLFSIPSIATTECCKTFKQR